MSGRRASAAARRPGWRTVIARFLLNRLALSIITLLLLSVIVFAASQLLPGDVGRNVLGPFASPEDVAKFNHEHGVDRPVWTQYWDWISNFVRGDLGTSLQHNVSVGELLGPSLVNSAFKSKGVWNAAHYSNKKFDAAAKAFAAAIALSDQRKYEKQMQLMLLRDTPVILPYFYNYLGAGLTKVKGYEAEAIGNTFLSRSSLA